MRPAGMRLYHIASEADWLARDGSSYRPDGFDREGFVHCSSAEQLVEVANRMFRGRRDLVVLEIVAELLDPDVVWEDLYDAGSEYPHVYGPVDLRAISSATPLIPGPDGTFDGWTPDQPASS